MEVAYSDNVVDIHIYKKGPSGRPLAMVTASPSIPLDKLTGAIQKTVTRNTDLRTKLGLQGCHGCASSGIDLDIRHRFDHVFRVDLGTIG
jgi:hypothetical protein